MKIPGWGGAPGAVLLAAVVAGCGAPERAPERQPNLSGYSQAFKQGYADGCDSAGARKRRDEERYKAEADYKMGWNDGYSVCRRR